MCRDFLADPLPTEVVDRLLDRARRAPSAGHSQGWAFVVLSGPAETSRFWAFGADAAWLAEPSLPGLLAAPVIVVPFASRQAYLDRYRQDDKRALGRSQPEGWPVPYWLLDTAMATMLLLLGAVAEGVGALYFALHGDGERLRSALGVPEGWEPIGAVALGWPAANRVPGTSARRGRRPLDEVVHRGRW